MALLTDTLKHLVGEERATAERRLVAAAREQDPVTFGDTCRRLLCELDYDAAVGEQRRRHGRRSARISRTSDGMVRLVAEVTGVDAETVMTAVAAFRTPDPAGMSTGARRRPEQATADALIEVCRSALRSADAPDEHGARPQINVTIDVEALAERTGVAELAHAGSVPFEEIRTLLVDAGIGRILTDARSLPLEAGENVRTVPAGLWRALVHRDRGCIARGCDRPPAWTDVMHLDRDFAAGGRLSLSNGALGCRYHHRKFDLEGWRIIWDEGRPALHPP